MNIEGLSRQLAIGVRETAWGSPHCTGDILPSHVWGHLQLQPTFVAKRRSTSKDCSRFDRIQQKIWFSVPPLGPHFQQQFSD